MGLTLPFFQSPGTSPHWHKYSETIENIFGTTSAISLRTLGHISSRPIRLMDVQVPQAVTNLIFSYSRRDNTSPLTTFRTIVSRPVCRAIASENCGKKKKMSTSAFSLSIVPSLLVLLTEGELVLEFPFPVDVLIEAFLILLVPLAMSSSRWALAFLTPFLHSLAASLHSLQSVYLCFHCLCIFFLQKYSNAV